MNRTLPMNGWYGKVKKNQIESILAKKCKLNIDFFSNFSCMFLYPNIFFQLEILFIGYEKLPGTS